MVQWFGGGQFPKHFGYIARFAIFFQCRGSFSLAVALSPLFVRFSQGRGGYSQVFGMACSGNWWRNGARGIGGGYAFHQWVVEQRAHCYGHVKQGAPHGYGGLLWFTSRDLFRRPVYLSV